MTIEQMRARYNAQPFQPFVIHLADGREIPIHHREAIAFSPSGRTVAVYLPDESTEIIDLLLVTSLALRPDMRPLAPGSTN